MPADSRRSQTSRLRGSRASRIVREDQAARLEELAMPGRALKANMRERGFSAEPVVREYSAFEDRSNGNPAVEGFVAIWDEVSAMLSTEAEPQQIAVSCDL